MKRPVNKNIIKALQNNDAIVCNAADELGVARQTLKTWIDSDPSLTQAYLDIRERTFDKVEHQLLKNIREGKETSLIWFTKTQMRHRGYIDKIEQDTTMNINAIQIKYIIPEEPKILEEKTHLPLDNNVIKIELPKE